MNNAANGENIIREKVMDKLKAYPEIFSRYFVFLEKQGKTPSTIQRYIEYLIEFSAFAEKQLNKCSYDVITAEDIDEYMEAIKFRHIDGMMHEISNSTRAAKWSALNLFFTYLVEERIASENPVSKTLRPEMPEKQKEKRLETHEITSILERIENESPAKLKNRDICLVATILLTEASISDILGINVEDIDVAKGTMQISSNHQVIELPEKFKRLLILWLKDRALHFDGEETTGPLFISRKRQRLSMDSAQEVIRKYTSHIPRRITPHTLRSAGAGRLFDSNVTVTADTAIFGEDRDKMPSPQDLWTEILLELEQKIPRPYYVSLRNPDVVTVSFGSDTLYLHINPKQYFFADRINTPRIRDAISEVAKKVSNKQYVVSVSLPSEQAALNEIKTTTEASAVTNNEPEPRGKDNEPSTESQPNTLNSREEAQVASTTIKAPFDPNKYAIPGPPYAVAVGKKFLSFFIHGGKVYNIGAGVPVVLSGKGRQRLVSDCKVIFAMVTEHYFRETSEECTILICTRGGNYAPDFRISVGVNNLDEYIEEVKAEPISTDPSDYNDYTQTYKETYYDKRLTPEESSMLCDAIKRGAPLNPYIPERLKKDGEQAEQSEKKKPLFKDWEVPELMWGWAALIVFFFAVAIFKDWYIKLILRVVVGWCFGLWRQKKVWGG